MRLNTNAPIFGSSGVLEIDGANQALTRLSRRDANLVNADGQAVPDILLNTALRGLSQKEYQQLLCLDDETIEAGGEEITKSQGDIGKLLFSAAAGISDLSQVLADVNERTRAIYRPRASTTAFAELKRQHDEVSRQIKEHDVTASAYRTLRLARDQAVTDETELKARKADLAMRKAWLENIVRAHPIAAEWLTVRAELAPIAHYPQALDLDSEQLIQMMTRRVELVAKRDQAKEEAAALATRRDELSVDPDILATATRLEALGTLKSRVEAGLLDLPKRKAELTQETADMRARLATVGISSPEDPAQFALLADPALGALERARKALDDAQKALAHAKVENREAATKHREAERLAQEAAADVPDFTLLEQIIAKADADDVLNRYGEAQHELNTARQHCGVLVHGLTRQGVAFAAPPVLSSGHARAVKDSTDLTEAALALKSADQRVANAKERWHAAQTRVELAQTQPDLVSDAQAAKTRANRDDLWAAHRAALDADTADVFEAAMRKDDAQTQLRAGQNKELAETRQAQRLELETRKDLLASTEARDAACALCDRLQDAHCAKLRQIGLPETLSADEFASWVRDVENAHAAQHSFEAACASLQDIMDQGTRLHADLTAALAMKDASLAALILIAKTKLAERRDQQQTLKQARATARIAAAEAVRRRELEQDAMTLVEVAQTSWRTLMAQHLPDIQTDVDTWDGLQTLRSIRETDVRMRGLSRQIGGITQDTVAFAAELDKLAIVPGGDLPLLDRYAQAKMCIAAAQETDRQMHDLAHRIAQREATAHEAAQSIKVLDTQTQAMAAVFDAAIPTNTLEQLRTATLTGQTAIGLRIRAQDLLLALRTALGVTTWDDAQTILADHPLDSVRVELSTVTDDLERLDLSQSHAIETRTRTQLELDAVGRDGDIAHLSEKKRTLEEQMQAALLDYLEGRFGHDLAEEAIRRYRDSHRSGMLAATEQAFSDLTRGAYRKLTTQPGQNGDVLMAVQTLDGVSKEAAAMSKGTRFQLYLALRAAAYDQMASNGTVLPFFCDDVFETFDEDRTRAACQLMQRVGRTGQAIYLTHHRHVVDIANEVCGDQVRVHHL